MSSTTRTACPRSRGRSRNPAPFMSLRTAMLQVTTVGLVVGLSALPVTVGLSSCTMHDTATSLREGDTPSRQFLFDGVLMDERREGKLVWTARARRADGDLSTTDAFDIDLIHYAAESQVPDYRIASPRGTLDQENRKAHFEDVRMTDAQGGVLTAGVADYDGTNERIDVSGPLVYSAQGVIARATKGTVMLKERSLTIDGPVSGTFTPKR